MKDNAAAFRIAICVCTYKRPEMLRRCLSAIRAMDVPAGCAIDIVIVDNDWENGVPLFDGTYDDVFWMAVKERGISHARNAAVQIALRHGVHMVAFIDDDGRPERDWLIKMVSTWRETGGGIVQGVMHYEFPEPMPFWCTTPGQFATKAATRILNGSSAAYACGGNILIDARLFRDLGMCFAPEHSLAGAEDARFMHEAMCEHGVLVVERLDAVVVETAHYERLTFRGMMRRRYQDGTGAAMIMQRFHGSWSVWRDVLLNGALTIVSWAMMPLFVLPGIGALKRHIVRTFGTIAYVSGEIATLFGYRFRAYACTVGR